MDRSRIPGSFPLGEFVGHDPVLKEMSVARSETESLVVLRRREIGRIEVLRIAVRKLVIGKKLDPRESTVTEVLLELDKWGGQEDLIDVLHQLVHHNKVAPDLTVFEMGNTLVSVLKDLRAQENA